MSIKIITINIQAAELLDNFLAFIQEQVPDILLMQEVFTSRESLNQRFYVLEHLQNILNDYHVDRAATYDTLRDGAVVQAGNAILSKFPIKKRKTVFYNIPYIHQYVEPVGDYTAVPRNLQYVQLDVNGTELNIFNTHGIWGIDSANSATRVHMVQVIVEQIKDLPFVVLGGDLNVPSNTEPIDNLEQHLISVFKHELKSTLNMRRKHDPVYANLDLDMLLVSRDINVIRKECSQVDISDHLPLIIDIYL